MVKKPKISSTAYRVLFLMQLLNRNNYTIDALNEIFYNNTIIARTFSKEVLLKYISTLRAVGYTVSKPTLANNYTYKLIKAPVTIKLSEEELKTLAVIEYHVLSLYQEKLHKNYNNFVKKLSRYLTKNQLNTLELKKKINISKTKDSSSKYSQYADLIKKFEQYCIEDQRIIVKYKFPLDNEEKQIVMEPKSLKYDSNDIYISGYNSITGEKQLLHLNNIQEIKQLPTKSKYNYVLSPIVFKLKGRVAKGYRLYEDEKISETDTEAGTITIAAYVDDVNMLIQRLLKYGDYCEIIYPKPVREKIITMVQDALKNYEQTADIT